MNNKASKLIETPSFFAGFAACTADYSPNQLPTTIISSSTRFGKVYESAFLLLIAVTVAANLVNVTICDLTLKTGTKQGSEYTRTLAHYHHEGHDFLISSTKNFSFANVTQPQIIRTKFLPQDCAVAETNPSLDGRTTSSEQPRHFMFIA